jgi:ATPase subunit of ABC transporter with duplicated ATPase domains
MPGSRGRRLAFVCLCAAGFHGSPARRSADCLRRQRLGRRADRRRRHFCAGRRAGSSSAPAAVAIQAAAAHSGADRYLSALPDGYETILSAEYDGGRDLSGGQWQRVAPARAFIRDAPLIIPEEPTASMDPRAEHDLFTRIRTLYKGRTVLLISHRYNTVRGADHIYVLDAGQIIEHGNHDRLIAAAGVYAELFTLQAKAYTDHAAQPNSQDNAADMSLDAVVPCPAAARNRHQVKEKRRW